MNLFRTKQQPVFGPEPETEYERELRLLNEWYALEFAHRADLVAAIPDEDKEDIQRKASFASGMIHSVGAPFSIPEAVFSAYLKGLESGRAGL